MLMRQKLAFCHVNIMTYFVILSIYRGAVNPRNSVYSVVMAYFDSELLRLLPAVLRARDFHLYLEGGKRITDLWRWGGRAVLGHKPPKVLAELKNAAERGLFSPLPHPLEKRLFKALSGLFPGRAFRLYMDENSRRRALAGFAEAGIAIWRPFSGQTPPDTVFVPVLPGPLELSALVLTKDMEDSFPPGELIPPVLLAATARTIHNLAAVQKTFEAQRSWPDYPKIKKALDRQKPGRSIWRRQGIYLTIEPAAEKTHYEELFRRFLQGGFLLPPSQAEPAILPLVMSAGEQAKLAELLQGAESGEQ